MVRWYKLQPITGFLLMAGSMLILLIAGCGDKQKAEDADAKTPTGPRIVQLTPESRKRIELQTDTVDMRPVSVPLHLTGRIIPDFRHDVDLHTRITGRITEINVQPGQTVSKGQLLARLDSSEISDLESDLLESVSKLKIAALHEERERQIYEELLRRPTALIAARAIFNEAKVQLTLADTEFKRLKDLHAEKIAATKDYLSAEARLAQARTHFEEAQANFQREEQLYQNRGMLKRDYQLSQAEADRLRNHVATLKQRLKFLGVDAKAIEKVASAGGTIVGTIDLRAPISGVVSFHDITIGELAEPHAALFTVSDMSDVLIQVDLPEVEVPRVKIGDKVKVKVATYPNEVFEGAISYIGVGVNPETRTVPTRAALSNPKGLLKKNMFAEIYLEGSPQVVLSCPKDAIQEHGEQKIVFVEVANGFAERPIKTRLVGDKYVEVASGLKQGDVVATQGSLMLKNEITFRHND